MADPIWLQKLKRALGGPSRRPTYSVSGVQPALSRTVSGDPHLPANKYALGGAAAGKPTVQYHTPMAGKKGLSVENMIKAMSELKAPTGMPFGKGSRNVGGSGIKPSDMAQGVDAASLAAKVDPKKRFWEQGLWRGIMG